MTCVDLEYLSLSTCQRWESVKWLETNYGHMNQGLWKISNLRYVVFKEDKHATLFLLKWS
jgi:hypothetical protein